MRKAALQLWISRFEGNEQVVLQIIVDCSPLLKGGHMRDRMETKSVVILRRTLGAALSLFFLIGGLQAQQVVENSDKPLSKNAGRGLPLQPPFGIAPQRAEWKGKIETENGVKVIKNPKEPLYGEIIFDLEEELTIGNKNDENYAFYGGLCLAVDKEENIFVLDRANSRIQNYDRNGHYRMTIGRKGQGPGEFQNLGSAFIDSKNSLYVDQSYSISVFDNKGKYIRSIPLETHIYSFGITADGNIIATTSTVVATKITEDIVLFDSLGKKLKTIASFPNPRVKLASGVALGARNRVAPYLYFCPLNEKQGVYGFSSEYKLYIIDSSGNNISIIEKDEIPAPLTKKDREDTLDAEIDYFKKNGILLSKKEIAKTYPFPSHKPFYNSLQTDDRGNIYVTRIDLGSGKKNPFSYDLFSINGYFLYKIILSEVVLTVIFKDRYIFATKPDKETGYSKVIKYRIKNWDQIKKGI